MKRINILKIAGAAVLMIFFAIGCKRYGDDYIQYFNGKESVYPGLAKNLSYRAGNLRTNLLWIPSPDPSVVKYVVTWNNGLDSVVVPASSHKPEDTVSVIIPNLNEYVYSFVLRSYDALGNRSIPQEINNVRVYGGTYTATLLNRSVNDVNPYVYGDDGMLTLNFAKTDSTNVATVVSYTNSSDVAETKILSPDSSSLTIANYKPGTQITYQSLFKPESTAMDTFKTTATDNFPTIYRFVMCLKNKFSPLSLYGDGKPWDDSYWTSLWQLWDGATSPQGWQDCFHSNGDKTLPYPVSFDMGATYSHLAYMEMIGRDCCHNPVEYEIWGSATLDVPNVEGTDANWSSQMQSSGWTLLQSVNRADDGKAPLKSALINDPPPVRYIRILIKKVASGDSHYSNITQVTFWNRE